MKQREIKDYLHLYLGCQCMTPDGIGELVGLPYQIKQREVVSIHFGKMVKTKNSIDGGYDKTRNHGAYSIHAQRLEPIGSKGYTSDGIDIPGGVKPILRPLSDMTEEEKVNLFEIAFNDKGFASLSYDPIEKIYLADHKNRRVGINLDSISPEMLLWFLSKGFDLFGLIPEGLALDKTIREQEILDTLNKKVYAQSRESLLKEEVERLKGLIEVLSPLQNEVFDLTRIKSYQKYKIQELEQKNKELQANCDALEFYIKTINP